MDLPFHVPIWLYQACMLALFFGPGLGRLALAVCEAAGWTRLADAAHRVAPFARGWLGPIIQAIVRRGPPVVLVLMFATGCGARGGPDPATALEGVRTVLVEAEPCMAEEHDRQIAACGDDASCLETTRSHWTPIADALDAFRAFWCATNPEEPCK